MNLQIKLHDKKLYIKILRLQILSAPLEIQNSKELKNISKLPLVLIHFTLTNPLGCACVAEGREISNAAGGSYVWVSHLLHLH